MEALKEEQTELLEEIEKVMEALKEEEDQQKILKQQTDVSLCQCTSVCSYLPPDQVNFTFLIPGVQSCTREAGLLQRDDGRSK